MDFYAGIGSLHGRPKQLLTFFKQILCHIGLKIENSAREEFLPTGFIKDFIILAKISAG